MKSMTSLPSPRLKLLEGTEWASQTTTPLQERLPDFVRSSCSVVTIERIEACLDQAPCALVVTTAGNDSVPISYVNRLFETFTGYPKNEALGRDCRFLQCRGRYAAERHPKVSRDVLRKIRICLDEGEEFHGDLLNFRQDGSPVINHLSLFTIFGDPAELHSKKHYVGVSTFEPVDIHITPSSPRNLAVASGSRAWDSALAESSASSSTGISGEGCASLETLGDEVISYMMRTLDPASLATVGMTSRRLNRVARAPGLWAASLATAWGDAAAASLGAVAARRGWRDVARQAMTLGEMRWRTREVGGSVQPPRCNFSACAVGSSIHIFGGQGPNNEPLNDTFVLNLDAAEPVWQQVDALNAPPGRWGHTLRLLDRSNLVLFGGCGEGTLFNDVYILSLDASPPVWRRVDAEGGPPPRSWHSACSVNGSQLVIFGGCGERSELLNDTCVLDLADTLEDSAAVPPVWRTIPVFWRPQSRLGHSMCVYEGSKILLFGGLASAGPVRLRSSEAFTIDLAVERPSWHFVTGSTLPGRGVPAGPPGQPPPPRLEHVACALNDGRVLVFGGSVTGLHSGEEAEGGAPSDPFLLRPGAVNPSWRKLTAHGKGPSGAWGHSACMLANATRVVVLGGHEGEDWLLNEIHELVLVSDGGGEEDALLGRARGAASGRAGLPSVPGPSPHQSAACPGRDCWCESCRARRRGRSPSLPRTPSDRTGCGEWGGGGCLEDAEPGPPPPLPAAAIYAAEMQGAVETEPSARPGGTAGGRSVLAQAHAEAQAQAQAHVWGAQQGQPPPQLAISVERASSPAAAAQAPQGRFGWAYPRGRSPGLEGGPDGGAHRLSQDDSAFPPPPPPSPAAYSSGADSPMAEMVEWGAGAFAREGSPVPAILAARVAAAAAGGGGYGAGRGGEAGPSGGGVEGSMWYGAGGGVNLPAYRPGSPMPWAAAHYHHGMARHGLGQEISGWSPMHGTAPPGSQQPPAGAPGAASARAAARAAAAAAAAATYPPPAGGASAGGDPAQQQRALASSQRVHLERAVHRAGRGSTFSHPSPTLPPEDRNPTSQRRF